jgi:hypothetical protein
VLGYGLDSRRLDPSDGLGEEVELPACERMLRLVCDRQMAPHPSTSRPVSDASTRNASSTVSHAEPNTVHAGVDLDVHPDAQVARGGLEGQRPGERLRVHRRGDLEVEHHRDRLRRRLGEDLDGSVDPRGAQVDRLGDARHADARRPRLKHRPGGRRVAVP